MRAIACAFARIVTALRAANKAPAAAVGAPVLAIGGFVDAFSGIDSSCEWP